MEKYFMFIDQKTEYYENISFFNLICRLNEIPIKITASYCMDIDKLILKFICGIAE